MEVLARDEARLLEHGPDALAGHAGVGRGLEHHELSGLEHSGDPVDGTHQRSKVGLVVRGQRRRDADHDGVADRQLRDARRRLDARCQRAQARGRHVLDVRLAPAELSDPPRVEVDADHALPRFGERQRERQADVAQPHDPDSHLLPPVKSPATGSAAYGSILGISAGARRGTRAGRTVTWPTGRRVGPSGGGGRFLPGCTVGARGST